MEDTIILCEKTLVFRKKWKTATEEDLVKLDRKYYRNKREIEQTLLKNPNHIWALKAKPVYSDSGKGKEKNCPYCDKKIKEYVWDCHQVVNHLQSGILDLKCNKQYRELSHVGRSGFPAPEHRPQKGKYITDFYGKRFIVKFRED